MHPFFPLGAALVLFAPAALAQTPEAPPRTLLGLKAGSSLTTFRGAAAEGQRYKAGLHFGVLVNTRISRRVSIQPEVLYSQKGSRLTEGAASSQNRFSYVDVPLLARVHFGCFYAEAGPQYSLLLSAKSRQGEAVQNVTDAFRTSDFGYVGGLGLQLRNGLGLGLRYHGGLRSTVRPYLTTGGRTARPDLRNAGLQASVFYLISGRY
ncbi:porin family protein [Hymenobacter gummosus]|nr:porin family protein [Hymenobacter gummosus]